VSDTAQSRYETVRAAASVLEAASGGIRPRVLVILGSGLGSVVDDLDVKSTLQFSDLPGYPAGHVEGHAGRFVFGTAGDVPVLAMQGRVHLYEGHPAHEVVIPVRAASLLGVRTMVVTNAAGGLNPEFSPGDIVLLRDHINLQGANPLVGPNIEELGPRFPIMSGTYEPELMQLARTVAAERGVPLKEGVYAGLLGPSFETEAETRMLRTLGADLVGMSTVSEAIAARHAGLGVLGMSLITNVAGDHAHGHEDVLALANAAAPVLGGLVAGILQRL